MSNEKPKRLTCCCCGGEAIGRQWHNRDLGYGLCKPCIPFCEERSTPEEMKSCYGIRGVHYDLPDSAKEELDAEWKRILKLIELKVKA